MSYSNPSAYNHSQGLFINGDRTRPNGILTAARGEIPLGLTENPGLSWMPRLNFAWDIGGKGDLVVRAGGGLFYNRVQGNYDYYSSGVMPNTIRCDSWSVDGSGRIDIRNLSEHRSLRHGFSSQHFFAQSGIDCASTGCEYEPDDREEAAVGRTSPQLLMSALRDVTFRSRGRSISFLMGDCSRELSG